MSTHFRSSPYEYCNVKSGVQRLMKLMRRCGQRSSRPRWRLVSERHTSARVTDVQQSTNTLLREMQPPTQRSRQDGFEVRELSVLGEPQVGDERRGTWIEIAISIWEANATDVPCAAGATPTSTLRMSRRSTGQLTPSDAESSISPFYHWDGFLHVALIKAGILCSPSCSPHQSGQCRNTSSFNVLSDTSVIVEGQVSALCSWPGRIHGRKIYLVAQHMSSGDGCSLVLWLHKLADTRTPMASLSPSSVITLTH